MNAGVYMVSAVSNNLYGSVRYVGVTLDNRALYSVADSNGDEVYKLSVPISDADKFEKSYSTVAEIAPQVQDYILKHSSPEEIKRRRYMSGLIAGMGGLTGAVIPFSLFKYSGITKTVAYSLIGMLAGMAAGFAGSLILTAPPDSYKLTKAAKNLENTDIKIVESSEATHTQL